MLSPSLEDYLEEIYRFSLHNEIVRASDIAGCLNVTLPSVNNAIRRLGKKNYLVYEKYKELVLTEKGRKLGSFLVSRNTILQEFVKAINSQCDEKAEAEAMEHYLSLASIRAIEDLLDFFKENDRCWQSFLKHRKFRKDNGMGLKDGYQE